MVLDKKKEEGILEWAHLTFEDVLSLLTSLPGKLKEANEGFLATVDELNKEFYWINVTDDFRHLMGYTVKFFDTCIKEISEISGEIQEEVLPHHVQRLHKLTKASASINRLYGEAWNDLIMIDDGNPNFKIVKRKLHYVARNLLLTLNYDLGSAASRLDDFIGRKGNFRPPMTIQQPKEDFLQERPAETKSPTNAFKKIGEYWDITYEGQTIRLKDRKGLQTIYILLQNPYKDYLATDLYQSFKVDPETINPTTGRKSKQASLENEDYDEEEKEPNFKSERDLNLTDRRAQEEYMRELQKIDDQIEIAKDCGDESRVQQLEEEKQMFSSQLKVKDHFEPIQKARKAVSKNVEYSLSTIEKEHPSLHKHLFRSIRKGYSLSYQPEDPPPKWEF